MAPCSRRDTLTTLTGYNGGPITLTLTFDADGFTASTDVGNYSSGRRAFASLTNGHSFRLNDLGIEVFSFLQYYAGDGTEQVDWFTVVPESSTSPSSAGELLVSAFTHVYEAATLSKSDFKLSKSEKSGGPRGY